MCGVRQKNQAVMTVAEKKAMRAGFNKFITDHGLKVRPGFFFGARPAA